MRRTNFNHFLPPEPAVHLNRSLRHHAHSADKKVLPAWCWKQAPWKLPGQKFHQFWYATWLLGPDDGVFIFSLTTLNKNPHGWVWIGPISPFLASWLSPNRILKQCRLSGSHCRGQSAHWEPRQQGAAVVLAQSWQELWHKTLLFGKKKK